MNTQKIFDSPLFGLGFRVFFALAGLSALVLIVLWNAIFKGSFSVGYYFLPNDWHAHEMLLGYAVAVITGFLLTAVKNWTNQPTLTGDKLAGLALLWLYGRILPFYAGLLPEVIIAAVDFAFLPVLAYFISKPILQAQQWANLSFVGFLLLLAVGNGFVHADCLGWAQDTAGTGISLIVTTIIVLILVLAGRVFPFFTERGLPGTLIPRNAVLDALSVATAVLAFAMYLSGATGGLLAFTAVIAAAVNFARLWAWYLPRIWYVPLLWILYVGYGWIILGFVLTAASGYGLVASGLVLHAFTVGGIGILTLGMMARVALGHTGRALVISNAMVLAFVLINMAALLRVLVPVAFPAVYNGLVYAATLAWLAAFALFVFVYLPILARPRIDGQEG